MLYHLLYPLHTHFSAFNVFRYITFRTIGGTLTAFLIVFIFGPWFIRKLQKMQIGQVIRDDGPETHLSKQGVPTMGGVLILGAMTFSILLWADLTKGLVWLLTAVTLFFGLIGSIDDRKKISKQNSSSFERTMRHFVADHPLQYFLKLSLGLRILRPETQRLLETKATLAKMVVDLQCFF